MVTKINASQIKYVSAGAGAVETTVQSKLRELVSVGDYGDTDGIGTITINVPSQFATIQAAFNWLRSKTIAAGTTVVIQVADGTHDYTGTAVSLNHPQGSQIRLVGNETMPTNCVLTWTNTSSGIDSLFVSNGNTLGDRAPVAAMNAVSGVGARVSSSSGALRVDASGANSVYFHSAGGLQFEIAHVANAVNRARVRGSASGGVVVLDAEGVDTDIDLLLDGKGTGGVRWGKHFAGSVTTNGYVEWKLADGATVRVAAQRL